LYNIIWFQDAKRDETARRAYKLLATLHSDCSELVQMLEETGATVREIRDLEEQVMLTILNGIFQFMLGTCTLSFYGRVRANY
jgi:hypothetical protein